jgi:ComF family protein
MNTGAWHYGLAGAQEVLRAAAESLFAVLFPSDCRFCQSALTEISPVPVCESCLQKVAPLAGVLCNICGEKLVSKFVETEQGPRCGMCRRAAPAFERAIAFGAYDGVLRDLIHLLKYERVRPVSILLGRLLSQALAGILLPQQLLVIPVPLFKRKLRERGFNQAEEIARAFARQRGEAGIQLNTSSLVRTRQTLSQTGLTRHQRRTNVRGAFVVVKPERIVERNVLLVDDVMTTGTTVSECARMLLRAGARQVIVATVARANRETEMHLRHREWALVAHA